MNRASLYKVAYRIALRAALAVIILGVFISVQAYAGQSAPKQPNAVASDTDDVDKRDNLSRTPLMLAAKKGDLSEMERLIRAGAEIDARNNKGHTPLLFAAYKGRTEAVRLLLDSGADVNASSREGTTALMYAAEYGNLELAKVLFEYGADPHIKKGAWNAQGVARYFDKDDVADYISDNCPLHGRNSGSYTGPEPAGVCEKYMKGKNKPARKVEVPRDVTELTDAALDGNIVKVRYLLSNGTDVDARDEDGCTALIHAAKRGHGMTAVMLINSGADVNAKDGDGHTALYYAEKSGDGKMVDLLVESGAVSK